MPKDELHPVSYSNPEKHVGHPKVCPLDVYRATATPEEKHAAAIKAGRNSGLTKRKRKAMKELCQFMLDAELLDTDEIKYELEARGFDATGAGAMLFAQLGKALEGDTRAAEFLRDTSGNKPTDNLAVGNLDDKPFETIDLSQLTEAQLQSMIQDRLEEE